MWLLLWHAQKIVEKWYTDLLFEKEMKTEKYANVDVKYISRRPTLYVENLNKYQNKQKDLSEIGKDGCQ